MYRRIYPAQYRRADAVDAGTRQCTSGRCDAVDVDASKGPGAKCDLFDLFYLILFIQLI